MKYSQLVKSIPSAEITSHYLTYALLGDPKSWEVTINGARVSFLDGYTVFQGGKITPQWSVFFKPRRLLRALKARGYECPDIADWSYDPLTYKK